jgi:hypothetical protein
MLFVRTTVRIVATTISLWAGLRCSPMSVKTADTEWISNPQSSEEWLFFANVGSGKKIVENFDCPRH